MIIFPAIDIYAGKAVRLRGGKFDEVTVYGDPVDMAKRFLDAGAQWLHVVDLNGAEGSGNNFLVIEKIAAMSLCVQSGGGLRDRARIKELLSAGAKRAVLGTICADNPNKVAELLSEFGTESIVCGLDVKDGARRSKCGRHGGVAGKTRRVGNSERRSQRYLRHRSVKTTRSVRSNNRQSILRK